MKITVLGAGAWGTAVAIHIAKQIDQQADRSNQEIKILLWARSSQQILEMKTSNRNQKYLPAIELPSQLQLEENFESAANFASAEDDLLIIATPLAGLASTCQALLALTNTPKNWVWLCKGIEPNTSALPHEIVMREIEKKSGHPQANQIAFGVLSGPSFAIEVAKGLPCALTVASKNNHLRDLTQKALHHGSMRIYATDDLVGVELGGAVKNILAIATGIADGLGLGLNARAGLITRGMVEMARLGTAMGAKAETFSGLTGLGDLILTATGDLSRNRQVGLELAKGKSLEQILLDLGHVAEGVRCAQAVLALSKKCHVQMPIVESVCKVLFEGMSPAIAVEQLMSRDARSEND
jgi:glycerol-3-phosphate dehydrogenase (NAD(P)+)